MSPSLQFGCLNHNGNLASVQSHDEYIFIQKLIRQTTHASTPAWIGGHKGYYRWFWSDGSKMNYQIWSPGKPSSTKDERCIEMNSVNGNWNDEDCKVAKAYVCAY
ncbi:galactose-specific lectin nattectin-like [Megalobrama amblycephala]|uniref:galactose-specific lectin nattectin-like n=1 Tax=Megalobrama amblycephala TaxID=75352 RepID=UPI002014709E|nr:galactose-specific lectin nattectin-like [Megalobrama amblycephala]